MNPLDNGLLPGSEDPESSADDRLADEDRSFFALPEDDRRATAANIADDSGFDQDATITPMRLRAAGLPVEEDTAANTPARLPVDCESGDDLAALPDDATAQDPVRPPEPPSDPAERLADESPTLAPMRWRLSQVPGEPVSEDQRPTHLPDDLPEQASRPGGMSGVDRSANDLRVFDSRRDWGQTPPATSGAEAAIPEPEQVPTPGGHDTITPLVVPRTNSLVGYLIVKEPLDQRGYVYPVLPNTTIGRQHTRIVLRDRRVSRTHARIELAWHERAGEDRFVVHDLGTPNGTWVNGKPITEATAIRENDVIKIGGFIFVFKTLP